MPSSCSSKKTPSSTTRSDVAPVSNRSSDVGPVFNRSIEIANRLIGPNRPTFIVAEIGVNHDGSLRKALELVDAAAEAKADAVKLQLFRAADLTTAAAPTASYQRRAAGGHSQQRMLARLELTDDDVIAIQERCALRGLICFATPFGLDEVARLARFEMPAVKIASTDLNNTPLLCAAAALNIPVILSTGAAFSHEICAAIETLDAQDASDRLILLHCVSRYPTPTEGANLRSIEVLRTTFALPAGFSDHTDSTYVGGWAVAAGACMLEKHLTLDRHDPGPDHALSLDPPEFAAYVACARQIERVMGVPRLGMSPEEGEIRRIARKSVVTRQAIAAGATLTADMIVLKRPGTGIAPDQLDLLIGRRTTIDVPADALVTWDMLH